MALILDGSNGLSDVDGTATTPAIRGTDTNTGIFFPAADTIAFSEGGTEAMRIDGSGNLGIGTSSPAYKLDVNGTIRSTSNVYSADGSAFVFGTGSTAFVSGSSTNNVVLFNTASTERMRLTSSGGLLINRTTNAAYGGYLQIGYNSATDNAIIIKTSSPTYAGASIIFENSSGGISGLINNTATTTTYGTSSDYRLKKDIQPMTDALNKVIQLKPVTYKWKYDGSAGQGFIAHELAEVVPDAVVGQKDAVEVYIDDNGIEKTRERHQSIDTSFLVATLTAAIQELKAEFDTVKAELATLKA
jgi:hypothetical protein